MALKEDLDRLMRKKPGRVVAIHEDDAREIVRDAIAPLTARIAELEAENAQLTIERNEAQAMRRWNIDRTGDGEVLVCRGYHDKGEDCDHERFVPEDRLAAAEAALQQVTAERDEARAENDRFRAGFANGSGPCAYCNLSREDWSKCRSGFPGCDRADDAMLCPHFGAEMEANDRADTANAEIARLRAEVEAVLDEATRMSSILLMAGEMTAQERRTARAVALGISLKVHTALARAATAREGAPQSVLRHLSDEERQARAKALGEARQQEIAAALNREEADRG